MALQLSFKPPTKETRDYAKHLNDKALSFTRQAVVTTGKGWFHRGFCMFSFKEHDDAKDFLRAVHDLNMEHKEQAK
jgi:hypothetical protein